MAAESSKNAAGDDANLPSDAKRSLISLFLVLHLLCVFIAASASVEASALQARFMAIVRPYVRLLNFELAYSQYNLTYGTELDVDHRIEILPAGEPADDPNAWIALPDVGWRSGDRYKRYQRLARRIAVVNQVASDSGLPELDAAVGVLARGVAEHFVHQDDWKPSQIRCRQHFLQDMIAITEGNESERDPYSQSYFRVLYAANVLVDENGDVDLVKISAAGEVARPDTGEK